MTVHRYVAFINFQVDAHNMILEPKKYLAKQAHNARFMITDIDVDDIVKEWLEEWCNPLQELLPKHQNEEDPQVDHSKGHDNGQGNK